MIGKTRVMRGSVNVLSLALSSSPLSSSHSFALALMPRWKSARVNFSSGLWQLSSSWPQPSSSTSARFFTLMAYPRNVALGLLVGGFSSPPFSASTTSGGMMRFEFIERPLEVCPTGLGSAAWVWQ